MSTNVGAAVFNATGMPGASGSRTFANHIGEYIYNVKSYGAVGNGSNDDTTAIQTCFDAAFGPAGAPNGENSFANKIVFFPAGTYKVTAELVLTQVKSGLILGAGKGVTKINNVTSGTTVFQMHGFKFSCMRDMSLISAGGAGSVGIEWTGIGDEGAYSVGSTWINVGIDGPEVGFYGGRLAAQGGNGGQGSEACFISCDFLNCSLYGLTPRQLNALNYTVIGGRFEDCGDAIQANWGTVNYVQGVKFANNSGWDYQGTNGTTFVLAGCYSTSAQFCNSGCFGGSRLIGCTHINNTGGAIFASVDQTRVHGPVVEACYSSGGIFTAYAGAGAVPIYIKGSKFDNPNYLASYTGPVYIDDAPFP